VQFWKKNNTQPRKAIDNSKGICGGRGLKAKSSKESWNFQCGGGGSNQKPSMGDIDISSACQFYKAKNSICKQIGKFNWIL